MARFFTLPLLVAVAPVAVAFCPHGPSSLPSRNLPRLRSTPFFAEVDFDAPVPADPQSGTAVLEEAPVVDDECYMGKDGEFDECVDFDPPVSKRMRSANAMDQPRSAPKWAFGDDFDAPVLADPQSGTAVLDEAPVVDDECYMGKDNDFLDCVDFDPPRVRTRSANAMDQPRSPPRWAFGDDFDAPVLADPQSGTAVLTEDPVVDDECYMGKDGDAEECVDFDPPV